MCDFPILLRLRNMKKAGRSYGLLPFSSVSYVGSFIMELFLYQLFHDSQQLLHILNAGVAGSLVDDRGVYVRNHLLYAGV